MTRPDYSPFARQYAESRPGYPPELFAYLASLVDRHTLAWDSATGNGQAATGLARHFDRVIATDISAEQIRHALPHPRIDYRVTRSEDSGLDSSSVDLATVASAVHWFDLPSFFTEVTRVVHRGGVLAVWTYHVGCVEPPFDKVFEHLYQDIVSPYFSPGAKLVDEHYETIALPGEPIAGKAFFMSASWNLHQIIAFIQSWSGTQQYIRKHGTDPVSLIQDDLRRLWDKPEKFRSVRWPLFLRVSRI